MKKKFSEHRVTQRRSAYTGFLEELEYLKMMVTPSKLSVIRKDVSLVRTRPILLLSWVEKAVRR